ncbi:ATP-dependent Clp protease proteolytic subunit [Streptomyces sp. NPDC059740]|uniref:ATP-dependent Clp protease proteolytic subunit n=1 Tax=Streptomyces sp. NPDC059740 TaxID=3346926 RepID=UPI003653265E
MRATYQPTARHVLPEFTERTRHGLRTLDPYARLLEDRIVFLGTPLDATAATDVVAQLLHLEYADPDREIALYVNSPGGPFTALTAVYDTLRHLSCDVATVCLGQAASTAAVLLAAGTPGRRMTLPGARVLLRQPSSAEPAQGQITDLVLHAEEVLRERAALEEMLARHTGRPQEEISRDIDRDRVLDAPSALTYGLVDHLTKSRKGKTPSEGRG